jgi:hypothetical protein
MNETAGDLESSPVRRRMGGHRFAFLAAMLLILAVGYVVINFVRTVPDSLPTDGEGWSEDSYPGGQDARKYLDGMKLDLPDPDGPRGSMVSFVVRSDRIESWTSRREDGFKTSVTFVVNTDQGRFAIDGMIEHHPGDGGWLFGRFSATRFSRR